MRVKRLEYATFNAYDSLSLNKLDWCPHLNHRTNTLLDPIDRKSFVCKKLYILDHSTVMQYKITTGSKAHYNIL
jgi:hypothetical protein